MLLAGERPIAAFILSLLGGLFILFVGLILSLLGATIMEYGSLLSGFLGIFYGIIIIICAVKMHNEPENQTWSILIIIFSVLSLLGAGAGLYIGLILGMIGGLLGLTWKPPQRDYPRYASRQHTTMYKPEITRYYPFCGTKIDPP